MSKKASKNPASKQRGASTTSAPIQVQASRTVSRPPLTGWRRWVARLALMIAVPATLLALLELLLRLFGSGYPTAFFLKTDDGLNYTANRSFGWQFFPRETSTAPHPFLMPVDKKPDTLRIFILGESAALGTPAPPFGFSRILEVMLRQQFPNRHFEVVNAAMRGIDSNIVLPIAKECSRHQPDLFIVYMGNNEAIGLYSPDPGSRNLASRRWFLRTGQRVKATKLYQLLETISHKIRKPPKPKTQDMEFFRKNRFAADDPHRELVYDNFRANLQAICELARRKGIKAIVSTLGANLKDFPPLGSLHRAGLPEAEKTRWEATFAAGIAAESTNEYPRALTNYLEAAHIDDHFAELHFRIARCYFATGQFKEAKQHYELSREWDALQFRADSRRNQIIRDAVPAGQGEGIRFIDGERVFAESPLSERQIPGKKLFNDHVHMSFDGDYALAQTFFSAVVSALGLTNMVATQATASLPTRAECAEQLGFTSWEEANVAAGMLRSLDQPPFLDQLDRQQHLSEAQKVLQERFKILSQKERLEQFSAGYRAAIARNPSDWQLHFTYGNFLSDIRDFKGAVEELSFVVKSFPKLQPTKVSLANALANSGRVREAIYQLEEVVRWDPDYAPAKAALTRIQTASDPFRKR